jgi:hypothetical protein
MNNKEAGPEKKASFKFDMLVAEIVSTDRIGVKVRY